VQNIRDVDGDLGTSKASDHDNVRSPASEPTGLDEGDKLHI